jgi:methylase of polypeptide subunit release factors
MEASDTALVSLARELRVAGYRFTTVTPATHRRVSRRSEINASPLHRVFGWSDTFRPEELPDRIVDLLAAAGELEQIGDLLRSRVRFSTLGEHLFVHSAFPTDDSDAVFFGPDTYRFARTLREALTGRRASRVSGDVFTIMDLGCGSGAGGIHAAGLTGEKNDIILCDINPKAVRYSQVNAAANEVHNVRTICTDLFADINEGADLIISNPPYLVDGAGRTYRHGGGALGFDLSLRIVEESIDRLYPGGLLLLYTGAPVIGGIDQFLTALRPCLDAGGREYSYEEIDPDVFGEELEHAPYDGVDRIAVVELCVKG